MAAKEIKENVVFLPLEIVKNSVGFSFDIGSSLTKVVYRSKEDYTNGESINKAAVKDGLARVYLFQIPRQSGCKPVTDIIKEKCDVTRPSDPKQKLRVTVTGVGANLFKEELEAQLNVEDVEERVHRIRHYVRDELFQTKIVYLETPEGDKPFLPCLIVIYGSQPPSLSSFEELNSKMENADGSGVDDVMSDIVDEGSDSDYGLLKANRRVLPFAKLVNIEDSNKVKKEDLTLSLLRSLAEVQGHLTHIHALAQGVRRVYFMGGVTNMELMRRYLFEEINGMNLLRHKDQQIEIHFVKQGGHMNTIGAFVEGVKRKTGK